MRAVEAASGAIRAPAIAPTANSRHPSATAACVLAGLLGVLTAAVATRAIQPIDDAIRRRQPHPRRGATRAVAIGIRKGLRPEAQLAMGAAVAIFLHHRGVPEAHRVVTAVGCTLLADKGIKRVLERRRPPGYRGHELHESFPSGHTAAAVAIAVTVSHLLQCAGDASAPRAAACAWSASGIVGESRLLLDDHWPSDVVAGALLGGAIAHAVLAT